MKLAFIGTIPSSGLTQMLLANGFEVNCQPNAKKALRPAPDLIAFAPKSLSDLGQAERLRKQFPETWLALVIPSKWLKQAKAQNAILQNSSKNDVWIAELWQATFWISFQTMIRHRQLISDLSSSSGRLVAQLEKDVQLATAIHRSALPKVSPEIPGISLAVKYLPSMGLGGDYYDIFELGDKQRYGFILADSKSHGMAAALLSILLKVRVDEMKDRFVDSSAFVQFLNREMQQLSQKGLGPISLLYGIMDRTSLTFHFTVAGDLAPLLWRDGRREEMKFEKHPVLGSLENDQFREIVWQLQPGDLLLLHTDGLSAPLSQLGRNPVKALDQILSQPNVAADPMEARRSLMALVDKFVERTSLPDDVTLIQLAIDRKALYVAKG